jgi:hypothetical protein
MRGTADSRKSAEWRSERDELADTIATVEHPPCNACGHRTRCAAGREACAAFALFLEFGQLARWAHAPRSPSVEIFVLMEATPQRGGRRSKGARVRPMLPDVPTAAPAP